MTLHPNCPHCGVKLEAFELPEAGGWDSPFHLACFNDNCRYYRESWTWMESRYGVKAGYRFRLDPVTGQPAPLAVWSPAALKDRILEATAERVPSAEGTAESAGAGS